MSNPFQGKSVLMTGASAGIGRALAIAALLAILAALPGCLGGDDDGNAPDDASSDVRDVTPDNPADADTGFDTTEPDRPGPPDDADDSGPSDECDPASPSGLVHCVDPSQYWTDLLFIAQERTPGSDHWQAVQDLCATRLDSLGFAVERHDYGSGVNVIGTLPGDVRSDEQIVVSAHYDHIPGCDGADDNASGVAGVLEVARVLSMTDHARTLVIACWDEEEDGLIGSLAYAERAARNQDDIVVSYVFDMIGYASDEPNSQEVPAGLELLFPEAAIRLEDNEYRGDFLVVLNDSNASAAAHAIGTFGEQVELAVYVLELNESLLENPLLSDFLRSDHAAFWLNGYPAVMISDSAGYRNPYYHCMGGEDSADTLSLELAIGAVQATVGSVAELLAGTGD